MLCISDNSFRKRQFGNKKSLNSAFSVFSVHSAIQTEKRVELPIYFLIFGQLVLQLLLSVMFPKQVYQSVPFIKVSQYFQSSL